MNRPRLQDLALLPAGLPLDWHEGLERLAAMPPPSGFSDERWSTGVWWAHQIAAEDAAAPQGGDWTGLDLFGLHPIAPACRYDSMGLAFLLRPGDAIAFGASGDTSITRLNGTRQSMRQGRIGPEAVLAWALPQSGGR